MGNLLMLAQPTISACASFNIAPRFAPTARIKTNQEQLSRLVSEEAAIAGSERTNLSKGLEFRVPGFEFRDKRNSSNYACEAGGLYSRCKEKARVFGK